MISRALGIALGALALLALAAYGRFALSHLHYRGEMDYIEGVMLDHVTRVIEGKPLYVEPSTRFITLAYMPGYTWVASAVARVVGVDFFATRLVSVLASLVILFLVAFNVRRETRSLFFAMGGMGLYAMGYGLAGGGHFDVSRPDSLMLAMSLLAFTVLRWSSGPVPAAISAVLLVAAFFTKQHAIWFGMAALLHLVVNDRPRVLPFGVPWLVGCVGGYAVLSFALGPWFSFYTWNLPSHWSTIAPLRIEKYVGGGLLGMLGVLTVPSIVSLGLPEAPWRGRPGLWIFLGLAGLGTGFLATLDPSAWRHVFIPSLLAFSVLGPVSLWRLTQLAPEGEARSRARAMSFVLLSLGFVPLIYPFHNEASHPGALAARTTLVQTVREIPGPVIVVEHGFYSWLAGKGTGLQQIAFGDLERAPGDRLYRLDPRHPQHLLEHLIREEPRATLVTDEPLGEISPAWESVAAYFRMTRDMGDTLQALRGFGGHSGWPRYVYTPVSGPASGESVPAAGTAPARP
jgi:hypothetical protein